MSPSFSRFSYQGIPLQVTVEGLGKLAYGKQVLDYLEARKACGMDSHPSKSRHRQRATDSLTQQ